MKKCTGGVVRGIDSWDLHGNRFFVENQRGFLFYHGSLVVSFSSYGLLVPDVSFWAEIPVLSLSAFSYAIANLSAM
jgi:hypothetical protein